MSNGRVWNDVYWPKLKEDKLIKQNQINFLNNLNQNVDLIRISALSCTMLYVHACNTCFLYYNVLDNPAFII